MSVVMLLFMNSIVIISSFLINYSLFRISNFVDSLVSWFILYLAQIIFSEMILGGLGILYLKNVILLNLIILLIVWLIVKKQRSAFALNTFPDSFFELLENKTVLFALSAIIAFGL